MRANNPLDIGACFLEHKEESYNVHRSSRLPFALKLFKTCCLYRIPPPPGGTAILPEYIHYYG
jgi:hypothetical protein